MHKANCLNLLHNNSGFLTVTLPLSEMSLIWSSILDKAAKSIHLNIECRILQTFLYWRAPQQMLRTHRSLGAYCATLWWRLWGFFSFSILMENRWNDFNGGNPKYSRNNLSQYHFVHHKSHMDWPEIEPGPPRWEPATNCLSHGTAYFQLYFPMLWNILCGSEPADLDRGAWNIFHTLSHTGRKGFKIFASFFCI